MKRLLGLLLVVSSVGCSSEPSFLADAGDTAARDATGDATGDSASSACGTTRATISGRTFAPNGTDPIPGVLVSVVDDTQTFAPSPDTVQCQTCTQSMLAQSIQSGDDGSFTVTGGQLDAGGTFTIVFESGGFRHVERHVTVPPCGHVELSSTQTRLPGATRGDDTIPRIAVAGYRTSSSSTRSLDVNDRFTRVLDAIGITGYDTVDPDKSGSNGGMQALDLITLLSDASRLSHYQIVVAPCGSLGNFSVAPNLTAAMIRNLQAWLAMGGRLYASDLAYSFIDQSYPHAITFAPGPSPHTGADPADVGVGLTTGMSLPGIVEDASLRTWLTNVGVLVAGGMSIPLYDLKDPWGAMDSIPEMELSGSMGPQGVVLVSGDVTWHSGSTGRHPLTAMVDYPGAAGASCGRVVFTSYHVQSSTSTMPLTPQERVLEYLFFRLSTCIEVPG